MNIYYNDMCLFFFFFYRFLFFFFEGCRLCVVVINVVEILFIIFNIKYVVDIGKVIKAWDFYMYLEVLKVVFLS